MSGLYSPSGGYRVAGEKCITKTVTIANGETASSSVDISGYVLVGIDIPTVTSTALGIQECADGTNYRTVKDTTGAALSWTIASNEFLKFDPPLLGYTSIKLVAGSAEGGARTLTLVLVP